MKKQPRVRRTRAQKLKKRKQTFQLAKHNHKYTVSACMIVKNESQGIGKSLASVSQIVDEIIVVDTGSTDGTQDICKEFEKVKLFEPEPILFMTVKEDGFNRIDFSANRNRAASYATGDWIFILDGDEIITQTDGLHHHIEELEKRNLPYAFIDIISDDNGGMGHFSQIRLHKNNVGIKWSNPVHNALGGIEADGGKIPLQIYTSYKKDVRSQEKIDRAEPMLLKAARLYPEETWPAYYLAGLYLGKSEVEKAKMWARRALKNPKDVKLARAWFILIHSTLMTEGLDEAEKILYHALCLHPNYPDLGWLRTVYALARWEITINSEESNEYATHPQKSLLINRKEIANELHIPWPFVSIKTVERSNGGEQPTVRN